MKKYELEQINLCSFGVIREYKYQVKDYDGDVDSLKAFVKELNDNSLFNIDWIIKDEEKGIIEETIDTLD